MGLAHNGKLRKWEGGLPTGDRIEITAHNYTLRSSELTSTQMRKNDDPSIDGYLITLQSETTLQNLLRLRVSIMRRLTVLCPDRVESDKKTQHFLEQYVEPFVANRNTIRT